MGERSVVMSRAIVAFLAVHAGADIFHEYVNGTLIVHDFWTGARAVAAIGLGGWLLVYGLYNAGKWLWATLGELA